MATNFDEKPKAEDLPNEPAETSVEVVVTELEPVELVELPVKVKDETPVLLEKPKHFVRPTPPLPQPETSRRPRNVPRY
jgi:hypothetical protein